jgi:hypothetical protein
MENGRYRRDWEPDRLRSRLTGLCFFTFLTMNNAHMLFLLFPSSGLLAGQTASFSITEVMLKRFQMLKRHKTTLGGSGLQGVPETWRQYRPFTKSLQLTYI